MLPHSFHDAIVIDHGINTPLLQLSEVSLRYNPSPFSPFCSQQCYFGCRPPMHVLDSWALTVVGKSTLMNLLAGKLKSPFGRGKTTPSTPNWIFLATHSRSTGAITYPLSNNSQKIMNLQFLYQKVRLVFISDLV